MHIQTAQLKKFLAKKEGLKKNPLLIHYYNLKDAKKDVFKQKFL